MASTNISWITVGQPLKTYPSGHPIIATVSDIVFLLEQINIASDDCQESIDLENAFFQLEKEIKGTLLQSGTESSTTLRTCPKSAISLISFTVFCRID